MDLRDQLQLTLGESYTIERELGGGGMSRVFVARELALGREVVIKVLPPEMAAQVSIERFKREISLAARLQQAHIVPLLTAGETDGLPYYTMPLIEGESLRARIGREGALPIGEAIGILKEVARALAYAHQRHVVHRDIKPDNVLLSGGSAMVTDFGVAKALSASTNPGDTGLTSLGVALGTPAYMAPEQASADPLVDHRADIYAWGVMAYELLTGQPPFTGRPPQALLAAHVTETPEHITKRRTTVSPALATLVMRCLEKRAADRPQGAAEIVQALESIGTSSGESLPAPESGGGARGGLWAVPGRRTAAIAVALVVVLGGGALAIRRQAPHAGSGATAKSIAVLPFEYLGASKENEYFSEGITLEITHALTMMPGLSVAPHALARAATGKGLDVRRAAQELGVIWLLQGTIQKSGDRVRITATLVDPVTLRNAWSGQYDNDFKDIFAVQDTIARAIAGELRVKLAGGGGATVVHAATTSAEAHSLYLQGLYLWNRRTGATIRQAISLFEQAIAKDPGYAQAHAGVGMGYVLLSTYADVNGAENFAKAEEAARRALAIDSTSVEAQTVMAYADFCLYRNASAEREFRRAIALDSSFATAHQWHGQLLSRMGRFNEAIAEGNRARDLDPQSLVMRQTFGVTLYTARRLTEAESTLRKLIEFEPAYANGNTSLAEVLIAERRFGEAIVVAQQNLDVVGDHRSKAVAILARAYAMAGQTGKARELLHVLMARAEHEPVSAATIALVYDVLGERALALQWLARGVAEYDSMLRTHGRGPLFDHLRADPQGAALFAKMESIKG